ncbi:MAG: ABC transporter ATP-binding protein [Planctomycetes bacterium]|nr:ABC transporter ATP-binding protein [Planctomycetota bacterium]
MNGTAEPAAISVEGLHKSFRGVRAVDGLDLRVASGGVYGLVGRNGAGKTTALRTIMGLLRPDRGRAQVFGVDLIRGRPASRERVAYVSQDLHLPGWMSTAELSRYCSHFYCRWDAALATDLIRRWAIDAKRQVALLSGGQRRRVAVLLALASRAEVLVLDEPAAGLDPIARRALIEELIEALARQDGCTVIFSTHIIADLERLADTIGLMDRGRLTSEHRTEDLRTTTKRVQVVFPGDVPPAGFSIPGAIRSTTAGAVVTAIARLPDEQALAQARAIPGARVQVFSLSLEDIMIELIGPDVPQDATVEDEGVEA